ncbi:DUF2244 domain-containing protein [Roseomonas sp. HJA6]|uniref:DUF2244 domain-containing protein n=2 Tax=Roseomonas alba TaxID=2846776 RepID=A0ABS7AE74_9PROT|nr:DUF2244 domain-containing protein [Neoroseomonas alba]
MMAAPAEPVLFQAVCTPPRSLNARGFRAFVVVLLLFTGISAGLFVMVGAWPILPFLGVEVGFALALLALHIRGAARMAEILVLTPQELRVTRIDGRGRRHQAVLDPYWARAIYRPDPAHAGVLFLESRGRRVEIGRHLVAGEKASLQAALAQALARARRPDFDNPQLR